MTEEQKAISSLMVEKRTIPPSQQLVSNAYINNAGQFQQMWEQSINNPDDFWLRQAKILTWFKRPTKSLEYTWDTKNRKIEQVHETVTTFWRDVADDRRSNELVGQRRRVLAEHAAAPQNGWSRLVDSLAI